LIADEAYFGLEAGALRSGAGHALARLSRLPPTEAWLDIHRLGEAFQLDAEASSSLLSALLTGGLLHPEGSGRYRPTGLFHEYAVAKVVMPLPRARAKGLIDRVCGLAARINADWNRTPLQIEMVLVSGSYMSRREHLPDLALSLVLGERPEARPPRSGPLLRKDDARRQILRKVHALSSFIVVRIVADRNAVPRPFGVVFQANEDVMDASVASWDRLRDWSMSITRRLASR